MKKGILYSSLFGIGLVLLSVVVLTNEGGKEYYTPRQTKAANDGMRGSAKWLHEIRANQVTGEIDPMAVINAQKQLAQNLAKSKKSASSLNMNWTNMGPNNIGGRTRAFLIDNTNPDIMYIGSVSGGLFKSTNAGASWTPVNDMEENLAVVSLAQSSNGDIYYGTGEGQYYSNTGAGSSGILGAGIFKSTDGGATFTQLASTDPDQAGFAWRAVGKLEVHPNRPNEVYAATFSGLRISTDGGATWSTPSGLPSIGSSADDMTIDRIGQVWVKQGSSIYKSDGLDPPTFTQITKNNPGAAELPTFSGRTRIAVSPEDENYVYVISTTPGGIFSQGSGGEFDKAYRSTDGGQSWQVIGEQNMYLNPHSGQGDYDNAVNVDPSDKNRILVGGVTFWEWSSSEGWQLLSSTSSGAAPFYVHADMHHIVWHPTKKNRVFAMNDGGIFRSNDNGATWSAISKGYTSAQFYAIDYGYNGELMGGTQDNGTIFIDPSNYYPESGVRTSFINYNGSLMDGDGGYTAFSKLDQEVMFKEMQYAVLGRSVDGGENFESIYNFDRMDPSGISGSLSSSFANFVAPFVLWEKLEDPMSTDSLTFSADSLEYSHGSGQGNKLFSGSFVAPSFNKTTINNGVVNTEANLLIDGFILTAGSKTVTLNASDTTLVSSNATLDSTYVRVYRDSANNNLTTLDYAVRFDVAIGNDRVAAKLPISYNAGDKVILSSRTNDIDIIHELVNGANSITNPKVRVQDHVQSAFFVGLRTTSMSGPNSAGGIWMTRGVLTNKTGTPEWWHIGNLNNNEAPQTMAVSGDGDILWVGTTAGGVYRFSNLNAARDSASADIDEGANPSTSVIVKTKVATYSNRNVTSISTHPFDNDKLVVTLGNYSNSNYVYYSGNATAATPTLIEKGQNLADMPIYASTFNFNDPNGTQVLLGTEYGVYATENISAASVQWTEENNGLAKVPVFDLVQQLTVRYDLKPVGTEGYFEGAIYAGTHGRGIFKCSDFGITTDYIGTDENEVADNMDVKVLNVYPNPASDVINIELSLEGRTDVSISIRNISGQLVKNVKYNALSKDVESLEIGVNNLATGTYVITMTKGNEVITGKFIKK